MWPLRSKGEQGTPALPLEKNERLATRMRRPDTHSCPGEKALAVHPGARGPRPPCGESVSMETELGLAFRQRVLSEPAVHQKLCYCRGHSGVSFRIEDISQTLIAPQSSAGHRNNPGDTRMNRKNCLCQGRPPPSACQAAGFAFLGLLLTCAVSLFGCAHSPPPTPRVPHTKQDLG